MISMFTFKGSPVYIGARSIVAIIPERAKGALRDAEAPVKALLMCEEPLGNIVVDETVEEAFASWYIGMDDLDVEFEIETGEEE